MQRAIKFDFDEAISVEISEMCGGYVLDWHDYVANEWDEVFPTLSLALLRAAVLVACGEVGFRGFFTSNSEEFSRVGLEFLRGQVSLSEGGDK